MQDAVRGRPLRACLPDRLRDAEAGSSQPDGMAGPIAGLSAWLTASIDRRPALWLLLLLVIAAVPRLVQASRIEVLCPDGAFYITLAQQLEQGQISSKNSAYGFNVYTLTLALLHRAGLDWETAAKFWGVLCGTLVVLPLFGWVRRQFHPALALVACCLYAFHPKMIEWSGEVVREATFWLLFTSTLYFSWRAASEGRLRYFAAAGVMLSLAIHTRFEGWFLSVPLLLWTARRMLYAPPLRRRLCGGLVVAAAAYPVVLGILLQVYGMREWPDSFHRVQYVRDWLVSLVSDSDEQVRRTQPEFDPADILALRNPRLVEALTVAGPTLPAALRYLPSLSEAASSIQRDRRCTVLELAGIFLRTLVRGFTPLYTVLLLIGAAVSWPLCRRGDVLALLLGCALTLGGMWIHLWVAEDSSSRYPLSVAIACTPLAAIGAVVLGQRIAVWNARLWRRTPAPQVGVASVLAVVAVVGVLDALDTRYGSRVAKAELGRFLLTRLGADAQIVGPLQWRMAGFYAQAEYQPLPESDAFYRTMLADFLTDTHADAVLVSQDHFPPEHVPALMAMRDQLGLRLVDEQQLPPGCRGEVMVLLREVR